MTSTTDLPHKKPDRAAISPIKFDPQKKESLFGSCPNILPPPTASTHLLQIHFAAQKKEELHF